jgi:serine/threonine protein kinase
MDIQQLIGITLGTCTLERIIGHGGMGAVYLAQQSRPVRTVAVKVLIPSINLDPDEQRVFLARFRREANTVAKLEHKNILPIYEYDEAVVDHQRLAYLVMPFIRGGTLRERMDEMNRDGVHFDLNLVASYISQVADALNYAHSMGVVHRDIKPGNLLFHLDGRLLLSDFGIVRLSAMPSLTTVGSFLGTAEYASPEQVSSSEVDARSDIYSLGIILYELLAGKLPFIGSTPFAVMTKVLSDPVPTIRDIRHDLSPAIEAVVLKSLAKNPGARYQSVTDMASSLQTAVSTAFMPASALRISGDSNNTDVTVAESHVRVPSSPGIAIHDGNTIDALPPTNPAIAGSPFAPWQQQAQPWQWPSQNQAQKQDDSYNSGSANGPEMRTYRQGRRLFYYAAALIALLLQFPVFILLFAPTNSGESPASLAVLLGVAINLLILAALGFTVVTRSRDCRRFVYRCLAVTLIAPLVSGFFIDFGAGTRSLHLPALAYLALLLSNIYALRQLAKVDIAVDQVEVAPIFWRPAIVGALTGLLPLTIVLIFALAIPSSRSPGSPLLPSLLISLFIALIGAPTPGAMMAVWLSKKMSFAELSRSSAIAGMLMFFGAFLFIALWSLLPSNHFLFFYRFDQPWIVFLLTAALFGLVGLLRGMLDAWVYQRATRRNRTNP